MLLYGKKNPVICKCIGTNFITIANSEEKLLTIQERYLLESKRCHFSNGNSRKLSLRHNLGFDVDMRLKFAALINFFKPNFYIIM